MLDTSDDELPSKAKRSKTVGVLSEKSDVLGNLVDRELDSIVEQIFVNMPIFDIWNVAKAMPSLFLNWARRNRLFVDRYAASHGLQASLTWKMYFRKLLCEADIANRRSITKPIGDYLDILQHHVKTTETWDEFEIMPVRGGVRCCDDYEPDWRNVDDFYCRSCRSTWIVEKCFIEVDLIAVVLRRHSFFGGSGKNCVVFYDRLSLQQAGALSVSGVDVLKVLLPSGNRSRWIVLFYVRPPLDDQDMDAYDERAPQELQVVTWNMDSGEVCVVKKFHPCSSHPADLSCDAMRLSDILLLFTCCGSTDGHDINLAVSVYYQENAATVDGMFQLKKENELTGFSTIPHCVMDGESQFIILAGCTATQIREKSDFSLLRTVKTLHGPRNMLGLLPPSNNVIPLAEHLNRCFFIVNNGNEKRIEFRSIRTMQTVQGAVCYGNVKDCAAASIRIHRVAKTDDLFVVASSLDGSKLFIHQLPIGFFKSLCDHLVTADGDGTYSAKHETIAFREIDMDFLLPDSIPKFFLDDHVLSLLVQEQNEMLYLRLFNTLLQ